MPRIFFSHSSQENRQAIALRQWLVQQHPELDNEIYLDPQRDTGIRRLVRWKDALRQASDSCEAVICLLSENWQASPECANEYQFAESLNKRILGAGIGPLTGEEPTREWPRIDLVGEGAVTKIDIGDGGGPVEFLSEGLYGLRERIVAAGIGPESFVWPPPADRQRAPYRGWEPLAEVDAGVFFGRDAQLLAGLDSLRGMRRSAVQSLFVVLGVSAVGKSSFLRAGLLPRLRRDDHDFLLLDIVRPQRHALTGDFGLARAISATRSRLGLTAPSVEEIEHACLGGDSARVLGWLSEARRVASAQLTGRGPSPTLVLPIDQGEELFSADAGAEAPVFLELIADLADTSATSMTGGGDKARGGGLGLIVVVTIRTDDYHLVQTAPQLARLGSAVIDDLKPMTRTQIKEVITGPAERATKSGHRLRIEPELVNRLLDECTATSDPLPLLALTLSRLYEDYGSGGELTLAHYEALGGMGQVVKNEINDVLATDPTERRRQLETLRTAFIPWLASIDPATEQPIRRLAGFDDLPAASHGLIDAFVEKRLLLKETRDGQVVEVALQSLLRQWDDVAAWLREEREDLEHADNLERAALDWREHDRDPAWLLEGSRLQDAETLAAKPKFEDRLRTSSDYLHASQQREDERLAAEKKHQEAELRAAKDRQEAAEQLAATETAAKQQAEQDAAALRKRSHVLRMVLAVTLVVAMAAVGSFVWALQLARQARASADFAVAQRLTRQGESILTGLQGGSDVGAIEQILAAPKISPKADAGALFTAVVARRGLIKIMQTPDANLSVAVSADGHRIAAGGEDHSVRVWDASTGQEALPPMVGHTEPVFAVAFSPDGHRIVSGSDDDTLRLWDAKTGQPIGRPLLGHTQEVNSVAFSPDGHVIASGSSDKTLRVWDAGTGEPIGAPLVGHDGAVDSVAFSPDGKRIVSGSRDKTIRIWNVETRQQIGEPLFGHQDRVISVAFSPVDGQRIVSGGGDWKVRLWDANAGTPIGDPIDAQAPVYCVAFSADEKRIVSSGNDPFVRLWNADTGKLISKLPHAGAVYGAAFDGARVVSASFDNTVRIWDPDADRPLADLTDPQSSPSFTSATFSPDGKYITAGSNDHKARLWDTSTHKEIGQLSTSDPVPSSDQGDFWSFSPRVAFSQDGKHILSADVHTLRLWKWDTSTGKPTGQPMTRPSDTTLTSVAVSPDGHQIVSGGFADKTLRLWDATTLQPIGEPLSGHTDVVTSVAFSPDGKRIVSGSYDMTVRVWDADTGNPIGQPLTSQEKVFSVAFSPDGKRIVSGNSNARLQLWDANNLKPIGEPLVGHTDAVTSVAFSRDGKRIISGSDDRTVRMWDADTGTPIGAPITGHTDRVESAAFSPDGQTILSGSMDGTVRLWPAPPAQDWRELLCHKLTQNPSHQQWEQWVSHDISYQEVCPGLPVLPDEGSH